MSYDYNGLINVAHGDGVFVAVSSSSNTSVTSTDNGKTWKGQKAYQFNTFFRQIRVLLSTRACGKVLYTLNN